MKVLLSEEYYLQLIYSFGSIPRFYKVILSYFEKREDYSTCFNLKNALERLEKEEGYELPI